MKKIIYLLVIAKLLLCSVTSYGQEINVNTENNVLRIEQLKTGKRSYLIYFQDSIDGLKYNFSIWDRELSLNKNQYILNWDIHSFDKSNKTETTIILNSQNFKAIEQFSKVKLNTQQKKIILKHFLYKNNKMQSDIDSLFHNSEAITISDLKNTFNWEADIETLSMLPYKLGAKFSIGFYHPGGSLPPQNWIYEVLGSEIIYFNNSEINCWKLKVDYGETNGTSTFWIDKESFIVIKAADSGVYGYRFKMLLPY
jgi:hypothetical protein